MSGQTAKPTWKNTGFTTEHAMRCLTESRLTKHTGKRNPESLLLAKLIVVAASCIQKKDELDSCSKMQSGMDGSRENLASVAALRPECMGIMMITQNHLVFDGFALSIIAKSML